MAAFYNRATLSYSGGVATSNLVQGEILEALSVTKTSLRPVYTDGGNLTYVITLTNSGDTPLTGLSLSDNLGRYGFGTGELYPLTYVDGSALLLSDGTRQATPAVTNGPPLVFSGITVPANGSVTLLYEATANRFASPAADGTIENTVEVSGPGLQTPVLASAEVTAEDAPVLSVSKSLSPAVVTENGRLTYTFLLQNTGNVPADDASAAVLSDTFDPILSDLTVTYNGTPWTEGTEYRYDPTTGAFTTSPGVLALPAADFAQDPVTGVYSVTPGSGTLVVSGTV